MFSSKVALSNKRLCISLPLLSLSAVLLASCSEEKSETDHVVRPVKVVEIGDGDKGREFHYSGSLKARTEMNLGFRVAGKITERLVDVGDRVKVGDLLARLDRVDYELTLKSAVASLEAAGRQLETADLARDRAEQLFARNAVAKSQLEQALLTYQQAVATRDSAQATLQQAENQVSYTDLKAVENGIVTTIHADIGQVVGSGSPIVTIAMDGEKEVQIAVPETHVRQFTPGKPVTASFWSNEMLNLNGTVREVAGSADARSRTFAVRVTIPNDPRLLLGMTATIKTEDASVAGGVLIPLSALSKKGDEPIVWIVDRAKQTVHARPVKVIDFVEEEVRVIEGLSPGDIIVTAGTQFMIEDMPVKLPNNAESRSVAAKPGAISR